MSDTAKVVILPLPPAPPKSRPKPLTAARIRALEPNGRQYWKADGGCPGLYVRVSPGGEMSYYVRGRIGSGRSAPQRNIRVGNVAQIGLGEARKRALSLLADLRAGLDPTLRRPASPTIRDLVDGYGGDLQRRGVVNALAAVSSLDRNLVRLLKAPAVSLGRADFVREIELCEKRHGPAAAIAFRGFAAAMLNWAVNTGALQSSVLAGYKAPRRTKAQRLGQAQQFTLAGAEQVRRFWAATEAAQDPVFRDYLRFLLLTGQRRGETAAMTWDDVAEGRWTVRPEIAKTGRLHIVPLGALSTDLLAAQPRTSAQVWPGRGDVPMAGWSKRLRPVKAAMCEPRLAMHALRRGYRTGIRELGADTDLSEAMIGHARRGLLARYDKSEMWDARVAVQDRWERWIETATSQCAPSS